MEPVPIQAVAVAETANERALRLAAGVRWNLASLGILGISGLLMFALVERCYGPETQGRFQQIWGAFVVLGQLGALGLDRSVLRSVSAAREKPAEIPALAWGALLPGLLCALGVALLMVLGSELFARLWGSPELAVGARLAAPGLFFFSLNKLLLGVVNGLERMRAFAVYQSLRYLGMPLGVLVCFGLGLPGSHVPLLFSISEGVLLGVLAVEFARTIGFCPRDALSRVAAHLRFGAKSLLAGVILELNTRLDVLMLGYFLATDGPIGVYSLSVMVAEGLFQAMTVLQNNFNPRLAQGLITGRAQGLDDLVRRGKRQGLLVMGILALLAVPLFPFAAELLTGSAAYRAGWLPFAVLMAGMLAASAWLPFGQALLMGGRPGLHNLYMLGILGINAAANALLIPKASIQGAALATALSLVWSALSLRALCRRHLALRL